MATTLDCLLHPIDCSRAAAQTRDVSTADGQAAALREVRDLPADDPRRVQTERAVREAMATPTIAQRLGIDVGSSLDSVEGTSMWIAIAVGAAVIGVIVVMLTIVHFTNRI